MTTRRVIARRIDPPIPSYCFDWEATEDVYDEGGLIGYGSTEAGAIADLKDQMEEEQP